MNWFKNLFNKAEQQTKDNTDEFLLSKDVMVGDWVKYGIIVDETEYDVELKQIKGYEINDLEFEEKHRISKYHYYAIPITEDMLKKNGYKLYSDIWYKQGIPFSLTKIKDIWNVRNLDLNIRYVHELQHLMNLYKINGDTLVVE